MRAALVLLFALGACSPAVKYGHVAHMQLAQGVACNPVTGDQAALAGKAYFAVTSRLPDCTKGDSATLTNHRADRLRYFRFDRPAPKAKTASFAFQPDSEWWSSLENTAAAGGGRIFVYVHGYRETPFTVARDSAQIARLSGFAGAVVQYGWSSQGKYLGYLVDETNAEYGEPDFSNFLLALAEKPWAKDIVVMTHSLAVKLALPAVEQVDRALTGKPNPLRNLIFASPDIDLEIFEKRAAGGILSPARVAEGRHVTIYASRADKALAISRQLHGYPRLGSPYCFDPGQAAANTHGKAQPRCYVDRFLGSSGGQDGLTLIDLTDLRHHGSGHSDFVLTAPGCLDLAAAIAGARGAANGRLPSAYPHVFTLPRQTKELAKRDKEICKLD